MTNRSIRGELLARRAEKESEKQCNWNRRFSSHARPQCSPNERRSHANARNIVAERKVLRRQAGAEDRVFARVAGRPAHEFSPAG